MCTLHQCVAYLEDMRVHGYVQVGSLLDGPEEGFAGRAPGTSSDCALENVAFKKKSLKGQHLAMVFLAKVGDPQMSSLPIFCY
jgi:hypothetical protein